MASLACVSEQEMQGFLLGQASRPVALAISNHLDVCAECEALAGRLDRQTDPVLRSLRRAVCPETGGASRSAATLETRTVQKVDLLELHPPHVAGYEILEELGRGGMSVVYKARQAHPGRLVALKMILAGRHTDPARRARLLAEADAIARLRHPHIVQIYEVGEQDGHLFLSLEHVGGRSLAQRLTGTPQPARQAAITVETLARAIHHAHENDVVHRDLKPGNVLLTEDGQLKITDFGLAKQERPDLTATGAVVGTPSYMAPEQAAGDNRAVGPAADVYALGAILYEQLTGRPPFQAATVLETLEQVRTQEAVPPIHLQARTPADLGTICLKCLHKEPHRRYATAQELADDLQRFLDGKPILARPVGSSERIWRWSRRNPGWAAMLASVVLLLMVIAVGSSVGMVVLGDALTKSEANRQAADKNLDRAQEAERATEEKLVEAQLAQARGNSMSRRGGQRFGSLAVLADATARARRLNLPPERFLDLRNAAILAMSVSDLNIVQSWAGFPDGSSTIEFDGDLAVYARTDLQGNCEVRRSADDRLLHRLPGKLVAPGPGTPLWRGSAPYLSPDARFLAVRNDLHVQVWRLDAVKPTSLFTEPDVVSVEHHLSRPQAAFAHADGAVSIYDLDAAQLVARLPADSVRHDVILALHPTEPLVASASYFAREVHVRNWKTNVLVRSLDMPREAYDVAWHPHGYMLAASAGNNDEIHLFDAVTFKRIRTLKAAGTGTRVAFSPSGDLLAAWGWSGVLRVFDVATGRMLFQTPPTRPRSWRPRFSRDGRRLAFMEQGGQLGLWEVDAAREYRTLLRREGGHYGFAAVGQDSRLLTVQMGGGIGFWDLKTGTEMGALPGNFNDQILLTANPAALVTSSPSGLLRWPIGPVDGQPATLRVGPPESLSRMVAYGLDAARDDRVIVACARNAPMYQPYVGIWVFSADRPDAPLRLEKDQDVWGIAVSPDGRWIATHEDDRRGRTKIWETRDGRLVVKELAGGDAWYPRFSPDGRWLAVGGGHGRLHTVGTWESGLRFRGRAEFSPDSRLLAVSTETGVIKLLEIGTGRELARLEDPNQEIDCHHLFTPDGTRLVTLSNGKEGGVHVWDLRAIRRQLKAMELDWEAPDYPPEPPVQTPLRVEIVPNSKAR